MLRLTGQDRWSGEDDTQEQAKMSYADEVSMTYSTVYMLLNILTTIAPLSISTSALDHNSDEAGSSSPFILAITHHHQDCHHRQTMPHSTVM